MTQRPFLGTRLSSPVDASVQISVATFTPSLEFQLALTSEELAPDPRQWPFRAFLNSVRNSSRKRGRPSHRDHDRVLLGPPGVSDPRAPHRVVAFLLEDEAVHGEVDAESAFYE